MSNEVALRIRLVRANRVFSSGAASDSPLQLAGTDHTALRSHLSNLCTIKLSWPQRDVILLEDTASQSKTRGVWDRERNAKLTAQKRMFAQAVLCHRVAPSSKFKQCLAKGGVPRSYSMLQFTLAIINHLVCLNNSHLYCRLVHFRSPVRAL